MSNLPNNFVFLSGYVKNLWLKDNVGTIRLLIESKKADGTAIESHIKFTCFRDCLESARQLKEGQKVDVMGNLSNRKHEEVWKTEVIAYKLQAKDEFKEFPKEHDKSFTSSFDVPF